MSPKSRFSNFNVCSKLKADLKCIRLYEYNQGETRELFHKDVPANQLKDTATRELLRALVLRFQEAGFEQVIDAYLTRTGKTQSPRIDTENPEPGVLRSYCGGNIMASIDVVHNPQEFRSGKS